jgi:hypothetical protein
LHARLALLTTSLSTNSVHRPLVTEGRPTSTFGNSGSSFSIYPGEVLFYLPLLFDTLPRYCIPSPLSRSCQTCRCTYLQVYLCRYSVAVDCAWCVSRPRRKYQRDGQRYLIWEAKSTQTLLDIGAIEEDTIGNLRTWREQSDRRFQL